MRLFKFAMLVICLVGILFVPTQVFADKYVTSGGWTSEVVYKGLPIDWWSVYFIKEFDKVAPAPGADWVSGNSKWNSDSGEVIKWLDHASSKGWVVKNLATDAWPGAIGIKANDGERRCSLYLVREVFSWGIVATVMVDGEPVERRYTFDQLRNYENGYVFKGYIWPMHQQEYQADRQKIDARLADRLKNNETYYKGYKDSWAPSWVLRQFDKAAPAPGVNWKGSVYDWMQNADASGWLTSFNPNDPKVGAILVRYDKAIDKVWIAIIRKVDADSITYEMRSGDYTLKLSELPQKNFVGYIYPERKNAE